MIFSKGIKDYKTVILIPAKKNSKRIKNKNRRKINGKELILYTIEQAKKFKNLKIYVSTNCKKIFQLTLKNKCIPILRPEKMCTSKTKMTEVVKHFYNYASKKEKIENIILLQPTSPLRTAQDILGAYYKFRYSKADYLQSFTKTKPIEWNKAICNHKVIDYKINNKFPKNHNYILNGAIYIYGKKFLKFDNKIKLKLIPYIMPFERSIDIDHIGEFKYFKSIVK